MTIEQLADEFIRSDIGGVIVTDRARTVLFRDANARLSEAAMTRFLSRVPLFDAEDRRKLWELTDAETGKYYRVISAGKLYDGQICSFHCLTDITAMADLSKDISEYSGKISDFSDFEMNILNVISKEFYSFLPALAKLCASSETLIRMEDPARGKLITVTFDGELDIKEIPLADAPDDVFDVKRLDVKDGYGCLMCGTADGRRYCVMLRETDNLIRGYLSDISVYNVVRLFVENGVLREKIIYENEHDRLTGFFSAGKYMTMLAGNFGRPASLAVYIVNVHDLGYVNDHFGTDAGDSIIKKASECIAPDLSDNIQAYRIGGDKFAVTAADVTEEEAEALMKGWKKRMDSLGTNESGLRCVFTTGFAYGKDSFDADELVECADVGMYREKRRLKEELIRNAAAT